MTPWSLTGQSGGSAPPSLPHRYHWACTPASAPGRSCFVGSSARSLDVQAPTLSFAVDSLSSGYDQFLVTLTVSSHGRNSSEAQVFLSTLPDLALRCQLPCCPHNAHLGTPGQAGGGSHQRNPLCTWEVGSDTDPLR